MWLLVGSLAVLLGLLAMLQYRWAGEIGRAEAERQQHRLERSARRFAEELRRNVGRVMLAFRPDFSGGSGDVRMRQLDRLARWQQSEHADLVTRIVLLTRPGTGDLVVEAADAGSNEFVPIALPAGLESVQQRLEADDDARAFRGGFRWNWMLRKPLALVVPMIEPDRREPRRLAPRDFRLDSATVIELNVGYLTRALLPRLAEVHFGPLDEGDYAVAVLSRHDGTILYSSDPSLGPAELEHGDVRLGLLSQQGWTGWPGSPGGRFNRGSRPPGMRPPGGRRPPHASPPASGFPDPSGPEGRGRPPGGEEEPSLWVLVVRHHGGSLGAAVAAARRSNLAVGLGILLLLGTAAVVLAVGGQRAGRLARQQLEFVAGVTHELHTPLAAIRSAGQNLADGVVSDAQQVHRYGDLIQKESARLSALVAQVLDFAGIESGARAYVVEPVALGPLVWKVIGDLDLVLEEAGLTVEVDIADELPEIRGDATALRRAIENLLTNSVKFAAEGGWVGVRARPRSDGRAVVLRVEDRGPGIPTSEHERVFKPFYRGRAAEQNQTPGSGLGLSMVRHVAEAHAGRVHIEPREEGGTAVEMELPIAGAEGV
ncbi:MAG: ATP-binding protein [Vicinamibacteria bacterium]